MKNIIKLEELAMLLLSAYFLIEWDVTFSKWWYLLLFFAPDIAIIGYWINNKTGAFLYNFTHHKMVAITTFILGLLFPNDILMVSGAIMFGHSSFDRLLGFGLKFQDHFKHTHLGWMK